MRKLFFLFFLFLGLSAFPQSRQVRVTTKKGSVFEGTLKEFKAFEHLIVEVNGKNLLIPYETMAYIDDVTSPAVAELVEAPSKSAKPKRVKPPKPPKAPKAPKAPKPAKEPKPAVAASPAVAVLRQAQEPSPVAAPPAAVAEPVEAPKPAVAEPAALDHKSLATNGTQEAPLAAASPFRGFLLSSGNNVYLHCTSDPSDSSYDAAALDVLKRQLRRYNFWTIVDTPAAAHFTINYTLGSAKVTLSISSDRTSSQETLGTAKRPEDPDDYRKIVYDLFQKHLLPLQSKISANTPPKRLKSLFTLE